MRPVLASGHPLLAALSRMTSHATACTPCSGSGSLPGRTPCTSCSETGMTSKVKACGRCFESGVSWTTETCNRCTEHQGYDGRVCEYCQGQGTRPLQVTCTTCHGAGRYTRSKLCSECRGTGNIPTSSECPTCSGSGVRVPEDLHPIRRVPTNSSYVCLTKHAPAVHLRPLTCPICRSLLMASPATALEQIHGCTRKK